MLSHPILLTVAIIAGIAYLGGALLMLQMRSARPGFEAEDGFHFSDEIEDLVVLADEERPDWFSGRLAERFSARRIEIFAAAAA